MSTGFDLSLAQDVTSAEDTGTVVHLRDHAKKKMFHGDKPVTVTVAGTYSDRYRNAMDEQRERVVRDRRTDLDAAELRKEQLETIAACVITWDGFFANGKPLDPSIPNVVAVLTKAPWIREQIETAMTDHAGFFKASSASR